MSVKVACSDSQTNLAAGAAPAFVCTMQTHDPGPTWVHLSGELDIASTPQLETTLGLSDSRRLVILDLRALSFLHASGVEKIVEASTRARRTYRWFIVIRSRGTQVDRMLALSGASDVLNLVDLDLPNSREPVKQTETNPDKRPAT